MADSFIVQAEHFIGFGLMLAVGLSALYMRARQVRREHAAEIKAAREKHDEEIEKEVRRRLDVEARIAALESWKESHAEGCSQEHGDIRESVEELRKEGSAGRKLIYDRLSGLEATQGEIKGTLSTLLQVFQKAA